METLERAKEVSGIEADNARNGIQEPLYFIGPLNFNRQTKKATSLMNEELPLDEDEFDVLYLLATREGETLAFEPIYTAVWGAGDGSCERETAKVRIDRLSQKIKEAGEGLMWIEHKADAGYSFRINGKYNRENSNRICKPERRAI
jgi:two-component system OmpR family response regulator/two-component system response regulator RstA